MSSFGWVLAFIGFVVGIAGLLQWRKFKKMNTVPFRTPSQIAQMGPAAADPKGFVSTEGQAIVQQPLMAPMSGQPCLAYELKIERKWEKDVETENGIKTESGTDSVMTKYEGSWFQLRDQSGSVMIDATKQPDAEFDKSHNSTVKLGMMIPGTLQFGQMQLNTPVLSRENRTVSFVGTEKILKVAGNLYALGALVAGPQGVAITTPPGLTTGKLMLSTKGREALVKKTKRNMTLSYAFGGLMFLGGGSMGVFAEDGPDAPSTACHDFNDSISCNDRMHAANGADYTWTVALPAEYTLTLRQPGVRNPIDGVITITDGQGQQVAYNDGGSAGANAVVRQMFQPGTYHINVRDFSHHVVSGGYSFSLEVANMTVAAAQPAQPGMVPAAMAGMGSQPMAAQIPVAAAVMPAAVAPTTLSVCARAVSCCMAANPGDPRMQATCTNLAALPEASCTQTLGSFRRAVRAAHPASIAACN